MLRGTADIEALAAAASTIPVFIEKPVILTGVHCFQVTAELGNEAREAVLPPSLHPTVPPAVSIQAWDVEESPFGSFKMMVNRIYCRSGVRARGFTTATWVSTPEAAEVLASTFGFPTGVADVQFRHGYDGVDLRVNVDDEAALSVHAVNPEPMGLEDVQYTSTLNLASTPNGLRLVQVEAHHQADKVDRLTARFTGYRGELLGSPLLRPKRVVSASITRGQVEFPAVRFVCKPDELAFTGTEPAQNG
jgi:hypothetical protein